jgi:hypothetical protein
MYHEKTLISFTEYLSKNRKSKVPDLFFSAAHRPALDHFTENDDCHLCRNVKRNSAALLLKSEHFFSFSPLSVDFYYHPDF